MTSLVYQASRIMHDAKIPTNSQINECIDKTVSMYDSVKPKLPPCLRTDYFDRIMVRDYIEREILPCVELDSTPGVPYSMVASTNGDLLMKHQGEIVEMALDRLALLATTDASTAVGSVLSGHCDPVRFFVKKEPHKKTKISSGRFRLIASVSIVDQICERVLNQCLNKTEIANYTKIPSQPGMGFEIGGALDLFNEVYDRSLIRPITDDDVSAWDWSVKEWLLLVDAKIRCKLMQPGRWVERALLSRAKCVSRSLYQLSDGTLIRGPNGIQLSGSFNTSSGNSHMRTFMSVLVGSEFCKDMGDDCIEDYVDGGADKYLLYGFRLDNYVARYPHDILKNGFEFCSHIYTSDGCEPKNVDKMLMKYVHNIGNDNEMSQWALQFIADMWHSRELPVVLDQLMRTGWCAQSQLAKAIRLYYASQEESEERRRISASDSYHSNLEEKEGNCPNQKSNKPNT